MSNRSVVRGRERSGEIEKEKGECEIVECAGGREGRKEGREEGEGCNACNDWWAATTFEEDQSFVYMYRVTFLM